MALTEIILVLEARNLPVLIAGAKLDMDGNYTIRLNPREDGKYELSAMGQKEAIADQVAAGAVNRKKPEDEQATR